MPQEFTKDPQAVLDFQIDWSLWLAGDTIATSTWGASFGLTIDSNSHTTTTATVWVSGGRVGGNYKVTNHIVTAAGREDDRVLTITVQQR